ncbi:MAG: 50S ribosomal protein L3 [Clostridia bacterium]|nr:50S ribosomal protein L3 [Clostridia bacterium]
MKKALLGKKLGMTQVFTANGTVIPVTVIEAGPCVVARKKTVEKDGYEAVALAFGEVKESRLNKPELGMFKKAGIEPKKYVREFKLDNASELEVGAVISANIFVEGEKVDVTGVSKGHGFSGTIKRYGAGRLKETHGSGPCVRFTGSLGASSTPSKVLKGKKMPGQYGNDKVTIQNLEVVKVDEVRNVLLVKGAVPGSKGGLVVIKSAVKETK